MRTMLLGVALLPALMCPPAAAESMTGAGYACRSLDDFKHLIELAIDHDLEGAVAFARRADCPLLGQGIQVTIEQRSAAFMCVRPKGDPDCFWVLRPEGEGVAARTTGQSTR